MARIGDPLPQPEAGWKRYDDTDHKIWYVGTWSIYDINSSWWNTTLHESSTLGSYVTFKFYGTKIRLLSYVDPNNNYNNTIILDGISYNVNFSIYNGNPYRCLRFEKLDLELGVHEVKLEKTSGGSISLDAIDIDEDGYLLHPILNSPKTSLEEMEIGDCILCKYTATSGQVGIFSELGTYYSDEIPPLGSKNPDGLFYFIHTGYDHLGRMKLVADRNIQHTISWDTLNKAGFIYGKQINMYKSIIPEMSSYTNGEVTVFADSESDPSITPAWLAFDKKKPAYVSDTFQEGWMCAGSSFPHYLGVQYQEAKTIKAYSFMIRNRSQYNYIPTAWKLQGSNDGQTWDDLDDRSMTPSYGEILLFELPEPKTYKQFRLYFTSSNEDPYVFITEMDLYSPINDQTMAYTLRLLTGSILSVDKDNEWDKIIAESTLNGMLDAGNNSMWHYSKISSWTSTTISGTSTGRIIRGNSSVIAHSSLASNTANTTTGFRPVLLVKLLNENPVGSFSVDKITIHYGEVTISGEITDKENDEVQYRIKLNGEVICDWSEPAVSPISINYTIPETSFNLGSNLIEVEYAQVAKKSQVWRQYVIFTNENPIHELSTDKTVTFDTPINIIGTIDDLDDDKISYRIFVNNEILYDWIDEISTPAQINVQIPVSALSSGYNNIVLEYTDTYTTKSWSCTVYKKSMDSFYVSQNTCYNFTMDLMAGGEYISFLKVDNVSTFLGYIKEASLILNLLNGDNTTGIIKVAPVLTNWSSGTVSINNLPNIDTVNAVEFSINNITGQFITEATSLVQKMVNKELYGIAIYSTGFVINLDVEGNNFNVIYQPTEFNLPYEVFGNRVTLDWKPLILASPELYKSTVLKRSTSTNFSNAVTLLTVSDKERLTYKDETINKGTYYYKIEIIYNDQSTSIITPISITVPDLGYRRVLINGEYVTKLAQGIAYDSAVIDYDFYTTPDRIKIKPLVIGTVIGGKTSPVYVFEVINSYETTTFDVYLRAAKGGEIAEEFPTYALLPDSAIEAEKTKVEMSLTPKENFNPVYPLYFRLSPGEKKLVYIRIKPTLATVGNDSFQIVLSGRPV